MAQLNRNLAVSAWIEPVAPERVVTSKPETTAELGDLWRILFRRWKLILGTASVLGLAALAYAVLTPSLYTATAQLLIDPRDRVVVNNDVNPGALSPDGGVTQVESQVRVIESDTVLSRAIAETGLDKDPEFGAASTGIVGRAVRSLREMIAGRQPDKVVDARGQSLDRLRRKLSVKRADKVFVVDVIVTTTDPDKSARIVNAIAKSYLSDQTEARAEGAKRASGELRGRLDDLRNAVNQADLRLEDYKAKNGLIASSGRLVGEQQLTDSNARVVAARTRTAEARARLQGVKDARGRPFAAGATPEAIQSSVIDRLRGQYAELASKEADLRTNLGERHPFIAATRAQMQDVKQLIDGELGRIAQAAESEYQRAQANERTLTADLEKLQKQSAVSAQSSIRLRELERDVDASRTVYNNFLVRSRELKEQTGIDSTNARVITWARPPADASWPPRLFLVLAASLAGLGLGTGFALVREYAEPTVLSQRQLERLSNAPVVATLPRLRRRSDGASASAAGFTLDHLHESTDGGRSISILVTSGEADDADRKAVIDLLASVAVARGERVLIVDADMRIDDSSVGGLLDVLRGEQSLNAVTRLDPATGARRMGMGDAQKPVRDAFLRTNVERFLAGVKGRYELVILDGGVLSENLRIGPVAAAADRLLLIVRNGATRQRDLLSLVGTSEALGRPVSGSLLLDARAAS
ncbi:polysaccharide biosynthesis tyrosine autokinase [Methylobacterium sp. WL30]|uniref:GumC family protein n=1 Tax=unclassified Methylobacterium TaxID=2615210 RepID=UPI0011C9F9DA|nr:MULTISPECIES: exopolysaccharide transport family protein [unclassified Methylobacterium]TXM91466.1 polysaccharide biosynthesis tyrosine autokinase [Methylobacterium sp. WL116]TXN40919.1 polysaccharide biosynthesis tyrosine autokinase [Methylobacterium sp. WL93]TXN52881.1 polysaccharide biosynthesis tyrosine autokinase [Methylobacterium sp. WL119]TXN70554.1 polysaccharide biosynthesis tyrosine autokinase [Methylobacterium sp. WL30]